MLVKLFQENSWIASSDSGKMEFSLSFTNVAEGILTVMYFLIPINVSHTHKICDN